LWHERRLVAAAIVPLGIYLSAADVLALRAGIWAIDPAQSTGVFIGGLPIEEAVFFFITTILITFGMTLTLSEESRKRLPLPSRDGNQATIGE
jgi:lycopene cyclase domain-containing protein